MLHVYSAIEYTATQHDIAANNIYTCTNGLDRHTHMHTYYTYM